MNMKPYRLDWISLEGRPRAAEFRTLTEAIRYLRVIPGPQLWVITLWGNYLAGEENYAEAVVRFYRERGAS